MQLAQCIEHLICTSNVEFAVWKLPEYDPYSFRNGPKYRNASPRLDCLMKLSNSEFTARIPSMLLNIVNILLCDRYPPTRIGLRNN